MPTLHPYPAYADTDLPWLPKIPKHWEVASLRRKLRDGKDGIKIGPFGSMLKSESIKNSGYKVFGQENVIYNDFQVGQKFIDETKFKELEAYEIFSGDIVITMMGTAGRCQVVPKSIQKGIMDSHLMRIRVADDVNPRFIALLIDEAPYIEEQINLNGRGTIMQGLNSSIIKNLIMILPPLDEQNKILAYLDRQTAKIDALITKKQRLLDLLVEQHTALISQAVTKGLNPAVKMKNSGVAWLGQVPSHWRVEKNKHIYNEIDDRSEYGDEELLTVSHITGVTTRAEKEVNMFMAETLEGYKRCRAGDLAINTMWAWMGALGISPLDGVVSPSYNIYRFRNQKEFLPKYLDYLYRTPQHIMEIKRYSKGVWSSRLRLYPDEFFMMSTPKPSYEEQVQIVEFLDKKLTQMKNLASKVEAAIELQREYRAALISSVVTGKIDVKQERR